MNETAAYTRLFADNDSVSQQHIAEFFALLGGGVKEPGWLEHAAV
jgi:hypothetical protein